jgi:hypothetical protein
MKLASQLYTVPATGKGSAAAQVSSISRSVATATAAVFTRALAAVKVIQQINNSVQTAVSSAVAKVRAMPHICTSQAPLTLQYS